MKDWSHLRYVPAPLPREQGVWLDKQRSYNAEFLGAVFDGVRKAGYVCPLGVFEELLEIRRYLHLPHDDAKQLRLQHLIGQTIHVPWLPEQSFVITRYLCWNEAFVRLPDGREELRHPEVLIFESLLGGPWLAARLKALHERKLRMETKKRHDEQRHRPSPWADDSDSGDATGAGRE